MRLRVWVPPNPANWTYDVELSVPSATIKQSFPAASVVHIRLGSNPDKPHIGLAPWQCASLSSEAMATIEQGIRDEARISSGRVWVAPDGASNQQVVAMANAVSSLKGGKQVVSESTVGASPSLPMPHASTGSLSR